MNIIVESERKKREDWMKMKMNKKSTREEFKRMEQFLGKNNIAIVVESSFEGFFVESQAE